MKYIVFLCFFSLAQATEAQATEAQTTEAQTTEAQATEAQTTELSSNTNTTQELNKELLFSAILTNNSSLVQDLLTNGADPNFYFRDNLPALHLATRIGHTDIVEVLIAGGANPNIQDRNGWTALHLATLIEHTDIVEILIAGGANPNIQDINGRTALHWVFYKLKDIKGNRYVDSVQTKALKAYNTHIDIIKSLIAGGANPNIQDRNGWTALHVGAKNGFAEAVEILIAGGANPNIQDNDGWTALHQVIIGRTEWTFHSGFFILPEFNTHVIAYMGTVKTIEVLIAGGANPNISKTEEGRITALYLVVNFASTELKDLKDIVVTLLEGGADPSVFRRFSRLKRKFKRIMQDNF